MSEIRDRLRALPGVEAASATNGLPLTGTYYGLRWGKEDEDPNHIVGSADYQAVLPGYFETMSTPLLKGRTFTESDATSDRKLVVIDQVLAAKAFPFESAVGKRLQFQVSAAPELFEVIGVVAHQRLSSLAEPGREQFYLPSRFAGSWAVRTAGDPAKYAGATRAEIARLDRSILITAMQPMDSLVERGPFTISGACSSPLHSPRTRVRNPTGALNARRKLSVNAGRQGRIDLRVLELSGPRPDQSPRRRLTGPAAFDGKSRFRKAPRSPNPRQRPTSGWATNGSNSRTTAKSA
jgi:hypothetical protein